MIDNIADKIFHIGPCQTKEEWFSKVKPLLAAFATEIRLAEEGPWRELKTHTTALEGVSLK